MAAEPTSAKVVPLDPHEPLKALFRDLRSGPEGLTGREAARRLVVYGPNVLSRRRRRRWPKEIVQQLVHPLALLLWAAALLALVSGSGVLAAAIVTVVLINAAFAFVQEQQAERAVEALAAYLPPQARVLRDGIEARLDARMLVPGDVLLVGEGDRVSADARLIGGYVEIDMSMLSGESVPVARVPGARPDTGPLLAARDLLFSGTACTTGEASAIVVATGMATELGRIAALSERVHREESPLEHQVRRVAWLIAVVAVGVGLAFLPLGAVAGLPIGDAVSFAVGLLVANVPEGLLPTITLALAVGVRGLARRGAVVRRLSAVETLGSTNVICTDKTGTLTRNEMQPARAWGGGRDVELAAPTPRTPTINALANALAACNNATLGNGGQPESGDPTELGLLRAAALLGAPIRRADREARRRGQRPFDPAVRLMSTVDERADGRLVLSVKGAPEQVLARSTRLLTDTGERALQPADRSGIERQLATYARDGLRLLAVADRPLDAVPDPAMDRDTVERDLRLLGIVALSDPPRPHVADVVARCHQAGIRVHIVTGDHGLTAAAVARMIGIGGQGLPAGDGDRDGLRVVGAEELSAMSEAQLDALLRGSQEIVFARSSPEAKLRIADALRAEGNVVAMTGDGANDAPALRCADIGIAMGRSGTDVAREAATMVLTDDDFATIVAAVEAGRRVYDNIRKFVLYIFAHTVPEVVPFLVFALSGGAVPLPLTVLQILAIDLGTETLPALALGREPAEPGLMSQPPRPRTEGVIRPAMVLRAWGLLGVVSAALVMAVFFTVLLGAGWHPGDPVGDGSPLHHAYLQATTMTFLGIVACQIGTAIAARTEHASLRQVGLASNPLLLGGIAAEVVFAAAVVYLPAFQHVFGTAAPQWTELTILLPFPFLVWGVDELWRWWCRTRVGQP